MGLFEKTRYLSTAEGTLAKSVFSGVGVPRNTFISARLMEKKILIATVPLVAVLACSTPQGQPGSATKDARGHAIAGPDRSCRSTSDCQVASLLLDCCGSVRAMGLNKKARESAEAVAMQVHGRATCECLAQPTVLDSGESAANGEAIVVRCEAQRCVTRLAAPPSAPR